MTGDALCRRSGAFQSPSLMGDIRQWLTGLPFCFTDGGFVDDTNFLEMVIDLLDFSQVFWTFDLSMDTCCFRPIPEPLWCHH